MKTIQEHKNAIIRNLRKELQNYNTIFELKKYMIENNMCPRCGSHWRGYSSNSGHWCSECDLNLTDWEENQILEGKKGILKRVLKKKRTGG